MSVAETILYIQDKLRSISICYNHKILGIIAYQNILFLNVALMAPS